jgi:hypothetical protein
MKYPYFLLLVAQAIRLKADAELDTQVDTYVEAISEYGDCNNNPSDCIQYSDTKVGIPSCDSDVC